MGKNPQWLNLSAATTGGTDVYGEAETQTPNRVGPANTVMEILKIQYQLPAPVAGEDADKRYQRFAHVARSSQSAVLDLNARECVDRVQTIGVQAFAEATETGGAGWHEENVITHDLSDGNGNGVLYGGSSIFLGFDTGDWNAASTLYARILYRMVKVTAAELLGIVQE